MLEDPRYLRILYELVSGEAVSVNVQQLSAILGESRARVSERVMALMRHRLLDPPAYPFHGVFRVYPLLAIITLDTGGLDSTSLSWMGDDPNILAAYHSRLWSRDTVLLTYHEGVEGLQLWMGALPERLSRGHGVDLGLGDLRISARYFSNQLMVKHDPSSGAHLIERAVEEEGSAGLCGVELDRLDARIIRALTEGQCLRTNISKLSAASVLHRRTVVRRIDLLLTARHVAAPVCRFPGLLVPPGYLLTITEARVEDIDEALISRLVEDPHVPVAIQAADEVGNLLIFGNHANVEGLEGWMDDLRGSFPGRVREATTMVLPPETTVTLNHRRIAPSYIRRMLSEGSDGV